ncbi:MAG: RloB domain-containing protein [Bacteroidales bacterium]|nr:RloB domain-containing protein [Bacteroidales bacterium]
MPKKTKAIKKTDQRAQKAWLKKVKPSVYAVEVKEPNRTILIVAEGQTEKLYFESFPVLTLTVEAIDLKGQSKLKLIESTESILNDAGKSYDEVWCVFDMDIKKGAKEFADFDNAIRSGKAKGYKVAYSNDAFELWFYLHYNYTEQANHRQFYYRALSQLWDCNYEKVGKVYDCCMNLYDRLRNDKNASQEDAISRAEKLFIDQRQEEYHNQNPVTLVYELVRLLNTHSRQ